MPVRSLSSTLLIIPAYNEAECLPGLLAEVSAACPDLDVLVIDDGSSDETAGVAQAHQAHVLKFTHNLGVGGAVQAGFAYAWHHGYHQVVRIDADGQHPPAIIGRLIERLDQQDADLVLASRFLESGQGYTSSGIRQAGIRGLAWFLSAICRQTVTDPTSGCFAVNQALVYYFAHRYPTDYPEPEALALIRRQGYTFVEIPASFRERQAGTSSIRGWGTLYYLLKVGLSLFVDRARAVDPRFHREAVLQRLGDRP